MATGPRRICRTFAFPAEKLTCPPHRPDECPAKKATALDQTSCRKYGRRRLARLVENSAAFTDAKSKCATNLTRLRKSNAVARADMVPSAPSTHENFASRARQVIDEILAMNLESCERTKWCKFCDDAIFTCGPSASPQGNSKRTWTCLPGNAAEVLREEWQRK